MGISEHIIHNQTGSYLAALGRLVPLLLNFCDPEFSDSSTSSIGSSSSMLLSTVVSSFGIFDPSPYFLRKYATLLVKSVGTSSPPGAQSEGRACERSHAKVLDACDSHVQCGQSGGKPAPAEGSRSRSLKSKSCAIYGGEKDRLKHLGMSVLCAAM